MSSITVKTRTGSDAGKVDLVDDIFGLEPNTAVMHQVVTAQLAARRAGTQSTKTRAEKRGGGAKPWKQKGTGRARQGSTRSPQWRGGGVALGPKPRSYAQKTPKKMVRLALLSALSDRAAEDKVVVIEGWNFDTPKTKDAVGALDALGLDGRVLVVADRDDINTWKSFANLGHVHVLTPGELNAYDVLVSDVVVFTTDTLPTEAATPKAEAPAPAEEPVEAAAPAEPEPAAEDTAAAADSEDSTETDPGSAEGGESTVSADDSEDSTETASGSAAGGDDSAEDSTETDPGSAEGGESTVSAEDSTESDPGSASSAGGEDSETEQA
ncbi:MAG: 50S ribosomal protein L4 [Acidimicrobiales bacterium]